MGGMRPLARMSLDMSLKKTASVSDGHMGAQG